MPFNRANTLKKILRPPFSREYPEASHIPGDPHTLWNQVTPSPTWCRAPPSDVALRITYKAHGRVITKLSFPDIKETFAMISLKNKVQRLPPHPGIRPNELSDYKHPWYLTTDGSLGPYDPLRYTQDFRPETPWTGFHLFSYEFDPLLYKTAVDFFDWGTINVKDMAGGHWKLTLIEELLERRHRAESDLVLELEHCHDPDGKKLYHHYGPSLPFYDSLELGICKAWTRWDEGRDFIGFTLRYIGELDAISRWLKEIRRQSSARNENDQISEPDPQFAGVWVGGVRSNQEWRFLFNSPLSLYGLFPVHESHDLHKLAVDGSFDNDERLRFDSFLHALWSKGIPIPLPDQPTYDLGYTPVPLNRTPRVTGERLPMPLPRQLEIFPPGDRVDSGSLPDFHPHLPYTTYLFMDPRFPRHRGVWTKAEKLCRKRLKGYSIATSTPFHLQLPEPDEGDRKMPYHPAELVIPKRMRVMGNKQRVFEEHMEGGYWWVTELSQSYRKKYRSTLEFAFTHPLPNNDVVWSDAPWPSVKEIHEGHFNVHTTCPYDSDEELDQYPRIVPADGKRVYITEKQARNLENLPRREFIALPPLAVHRAQQNRPFTSTRTSASSTSIPPPPRPASNPVDWDSDYDEDLDPIANHREDQYSGRGKARAKAPHIPIYMAGRNEWSAQPSQSAIPRGVFILSQYVEDCGIGRPGLWEMPVSPTPLAVPSTSAKPPPRHADPIEPSGSEDVPMADVFSNPMDAGISSIDHPTSSLLTSGADDISLVGTEDAGDHISIFGDEIHSSETVSQGVDPLVANELFVNDQGSVSHEISSHDSEDVVMANEASIPQSMSNTASSPILGAHTTRHISATSFSHSSANSNTTYIAQVLPNTIESADFPAPSAHVFVPPGLPSTPPTTIHPTAAAATSSSWVDLLRLQRFQAQAYIDYRLNRSVRLPSFITPPEVQYASLNLGSKLRCYPLRISNIDLPVSDPREVAQTILAIGRREGWGEIIAISVHMEVDDTVSVEIGFRFLEDAMTMWVREGKLHFGRPWHISPISSILGHCFIPRSFTNGRRDLEERLRQLRTCEGLELRLENSMPPGPRLVQIQRLLGNLNHPISPALSPASLESECALLFLDGSDQGCQPLNMASVNWGAGWIHLYTTASNWSASSIPGALPGGLFFYQIIPYTRPVQTRTKLATMHAQKRSRAYARVTALTTETLQDPNRDLLPIEQTEAKRSTWHHARLKFKAWNSDDLPLPPLPSKVTQRKFIEQLLIIWNWYDECLDTIRLIFDQSGYGSSPPNICQNPGAYERMESLRAAERAFQRSRRLRKVTTGVVDQLVARTEQNGPSPMPDENDDGPLENGSDIHALDLEDDWEKLSDSTENPWELV